MPGSTLDEQKVNTRIKLAALWTAVMFCYVYGDYFKWYIPNEVELLLQGKTMLGSPAKLIAASVLMAIPPGLIILTVMAPAGIARVLNIVFGIVFTAIMVLIATVSLAPWWEAYLFYAILESYLTALIVWQAWKWERIGNASN